MRPLYIGGATGTGKSSVAIALAEEIGGEVVNADAYQLYRGLEIVSAAPTGDDRARVPHHLFGCMGVDEECNAGRYAELAGKTIESVLAAGRQPIVVGGSGLYLKSLTHGLSDLPAASTALRAELDELDDSQLVERLQQLDPIGAKQVNLTNRRYVTRAVEISILSGRPMSEVKTKWREARPEFDGVLIERPREQLYERINARVPAMFDAGLLGEIRALPAALSATAEKAIGVREGRAHLAGEIDSAGCVAAIQQASRRYAKRQLTWFRREKGFQSVCLDAAETAESAVRKILARFPSLKDA